MDDVFKILNILFELSLYNYFLKLPPRSYLLIISHESAHLLTLSPVSRVLSLLVYSLMRKVHDSGTEHAGNRRLLTTD